MLYLMVSMRSGLGIYEIEIDIGLARTMRIRMPGVTPETQAPVIALTPSNGVIIVLFLGIEFIEGHQAFVVGSPRPEIAGCVNDPDAQWERRDRSTWP